MLTNIHYNNYILTVLNQPMGDYLETHESYLVVTSRKQLAYQKLTKQLIKKIEHLFYYFTNLAINSECLFICKVSRRCGPETIQAI